MLRECRRVVTDEGRMVFTVISFAPGIDAAQRELAAAGSSPWTGAPAPYEDLLEGSGWELVERIDGTRRFDAAARRDLRAHEERVERLAAQLEEAQFTERMARRRARVRALDEGLLRRDLFVARPASRA